MAQLGFARQKLAKAKIFLGRLTQRIHECIPALFIQLEYAAVCKRVHRGIQAGVEQELAKGFV